MIFIAEEIDTGVRLDSFIAKRAGISRSAAARLAEEGEITLFGKSVGKKYLLRAGDEICLTVPEAREAEVMPENIPLDIIYEDSDIAVINKPSGMVVHPAAGNPSGTLVNALLYHCKGSLSGIGGVMRPGIVHRIDKDTSGLLVIAKNDEAHVKLSRELEHHGIVREYHALARGGFPTDSGTVSVPIGRHPIDRKRMAPHPDTSRGAKEAVTHYSVIARYGEVSYLKLLLETGRTHQIRAHLAHIGHPLPSVRLDIEASHSWPFSHIHQAFLLDLDATILGVNSQVFVGCHSFATSGYFVSKSLYPESICWLAHTGQPLPCTLQLTPACHS